MNVINETIIEKIAKSYMRVRLFSNFLSYSPLLYFKVSVVRFFITDDTDAPECHVATLYYFNPNIAVDSYMITMHHNLKQ